MNNQLLKKSNNLNPKTDITKAFNILSKRDKLYMLTLTGIPVSHIRDLNFQLTNNFFNTIHRKIKATNEELTGKLFEKIEEDYKTSFEHIDYLFVIEYGGLISKKNIDTTYIRNMGIHAHCIIDTSLSKDHLEFYVNTCFKRIPNLKMQNISKSNTKPELLDYLLKQEKNGLLTSGSYNYKISI